MTPDKDLTQLSANDLIYYPVYSQDDPSGAEVAWFSEYERRIRRLERIERELKAMASKHWKKSETHVHDEIMKILNDADGKGDG